MRGRASPLASLLRSSGRALLSTRPFQEGEVPLRLPRRLFEKLLELATPVAANGAVWMPTKLRRQDPEWFDEFSARHADGGFRRRAQEAFFAQGAPRFVPPSEFGYELPTNAAPEVAFAGRSNVGKSTLLGALVKQPQLCRRSKTPGCTTSVNFFCLSGLSTSYLVDLPGFGFAQRSPSERSVFSEQTYTYLATRDPTVLRHIILLVDARRGLSTEADQQALNALFELRVSHHVVLTKADLVHPPDVALAIAAVFDHSRKCGKMSTCLPYVHVVSAKSGFGVPELRDYVAAFLQRH